MTHARTGSYRRVVVAAVAAVAASSPLVLTGVSSTATAAPAPATVYVAARSTCSAAAVGHVRCFAEKLVRVSRHARGAYALVTPSARTADYAVGPAGGYTPGDIARAYGVNPAARVRQTVAIVDAYNDPHARADLDAFDHQYGLPSETSRSLRIVSQTGSTTRLPVDDGRQPLGDYGWSGEESLDLQAVRGMCHACSIVLVEAASSTNANLAAAEDEAARLHADEISNSFGEPEVSLGSVAAVRAFAKAFVHPGIVVTAAAGDDGMFDWDLSNNTSSTDDAYYEPSSESPNVPASSNSVVSVGGTSLVLRPGGVRASETVWNGDGSEDRVGETLAAAAGATGGGCSLVFTAARWQSAVSGYSATGCGTKRLVADVSAVADPQTGYDVYDTWDPSTDGAVDCSTDTPCWGTYGGTSLAAPLVAAMWALAGGAHGTADPALWLYGHEKSARGAIYDVSSGGNGWCGGVSPRTCSRYLEAERGTSSPNRLGNGPVDCGWNAGGSKLSSGTRECDAAAGYDGPSGVGTPRGLSMFEPMYPRVHLHATTSLRRGRGAWFSALHSTDPFPGGRITSCHWSWGDGKRSTGCHVEHAYAKHGRYAVRVVIRDTYGVSRSATTSVRVH